MRRVAATQSRVEPSRRLSIVLPALPTVKRAAAACAGAWPDGVGTPMHQQAPLAVACGWPSWSWYHRLGLCGQHRAASVEPGEQRGAAAQSATNDAVAPNSSDRAKVLGELAAHGQSTATAC